MPHYHRAIEIQQRLEAVLELVAAGQYSTPQIADEVDVSTATISRCIDALRKQGHRIESVKIDGQWCYRLQGSGQKGSSNLAKAGKS
ncbi:Bifunctional ligase/repressor BirA [Aureliella helgolandensis]|uniref:Bifunctional ligase/repressor BirA n=2 Tax=Aureliella helgolandensis TaxID=2527968 RepID=A0A518GBF4_9BACT|nr:Bifunctional ligase/repressor BirA [Aureliella helgolandensis]